MNGHGEKGEESLIACLYFSFFATNMAEHAARAGEGGGGVEQELLVQAERMEDIAACHTPQHLDQSGVEGGERKVSAREEQR